MLILNGTTGFTMPGPMNVVSGGTGLSSPGTSGNLLVSDGTAWASSSPATLGLLTSSAIGTTIQGYSAGLSAWGSKTAPTGDTVGTTDSQTLTNKTLTAPAITAPTITGYTETVYNLTGTVINPANGTIQYVTLTANTTYTESIADGQCVTLMINPSTFTVTWPTVTWIGTTASTAPTLVASVYNCITMFQIAGTVYGKFEGRV